MDSAAVNNQQTIKLNFSLEGLTGSFKKIILIFPGSTTSVFVDISKITSTAAQYLPFTCSKPLGVFTKKITNPKNLSVTIEKAQGLVLKAIKFEQGRSTGSTLHPDGRVVEDRPYIRREKGIELDIPLDFEPNQKYTLALTSNYGFGFSAKLVKSKGSTSSQISQTNRGGSGKPKESSKEEVGRLPAWAKEELASFRESNKGKELEKELEAIRNCKTIPYPSSLKKP